MSTKINETEIEIKLTRKPLSECIYLRVERGHLCSLMNIEQPFIFCIDLYYSIDLHTYQNDHLIDEKNFYQ